MPALPISNIVSQWLPYGQVQNDELRYLACACSKALSTVNSIAYAAELPQNDKPSSFKDGAKTLVESCTVSVFILPRLFMPLFICKGISKVRVGLIHHLILGLYHEVFDNQQVIETAPIFSNESWKRYHDTTYFWCEDADLACRLVRDITINGTCFEPAMPANEAGMYLEENEIKYFNSFDNWNVVLRNFVPIRRDMATARALSDCYYNYLQHQNSHIELVFPDCMRKFFGFSGREIIANATSFTEHALTFKIYQVYMTSQRIHDHALVLTKGMLPYQRLCKRKLYDLSQQKKQLQNQDGSQNTKRQKTTTTGDFPKQVIVLIDNDTDAETSLETKTSSPTSVIQTNIEQKINVAKDASVSNEAPYQYEPEQGEKAEI